jgi:hypothetical protein
MWRKMTKKLGKLLLTGVLAGVVAGVSIDFNKSEYTLNGNKIIENDKLFPFIVEYKGDNKIKYFETVISNKFNVVRVNGERYTSKDTLIFQEAEKRYNYIREQIDSIKLDKKESKLQKKLDEKKAKREEVLEVLRK